MLRSELKKGEFLKTDFKAAGMIDPTILRIFLAPEWVFRKPNTTMAVENTRLGVMQDVAVHAYWSPKEFGKITKGLLELSTEEKDMLIVAGSILWAQPGKIVVDVKKGATEDLAVVYNTTIVVCNGEIVHIYHKQHEGIDTSILDGASGNVFGMDPKQNNRKQEDFSYLHDAKSKCVATVDLDGNTIKPLVSNTFKFKRLKFGIEICIDHSKGVLKKNIGDNDTVDVQIVISCGMKLKPKAIVARKGGIAMHIDGNNKKGPAMKKTCFGFYKVSENGDLIGAVGGSKNTVYGPDNKTFLGKAPHLSFVYNDLIELDWFKKKPKGKVPTTTHKDKL